MTQSCRASEGREVHWGGRAETAYRISGHERQKTSYKSGDCRKEKFRGSRSKCDKVRPPSYLTSELKKKFRKLAKELLEIKLVANVDCDALARLLIAQEQFIEVTAQIRETPLMMEVPVYKTQVNPDTGKEEMVQVGTRQAVNGERERLMIIQDRCMKQCRQGAGDFGMTVSSRCRLVVPKKEETPENKFSKYAT